MGILERNFETMTSLRGARGFVASAWPYVMELPEDWLEQLAQAQLEYWNRSGGPVEEMRQELDRRQRQTT